MLAYPDYSKVPCVARLEEIIARLRDKPEEERNEYASIWLGQLVRDLTPKHEGPDAEAVARDILVLISRGKEIDAIKEARARLGIGLKEAHDYVMRLRNNR